MIAALYVDPRGCYADLPGVDLWDEQRDARRYDGPHRVVAHPPCSTWYQLAAVNEARYGHPIGSDGGCFEAALAAVRAYGGVLEHPAYSKAWARFGLARPPTAGGWVPADSRGGWTCHVEQQAYGHVARKATWLYAVDAFLPELQWGNHGRARALVSWCKNHVSESENRPRIGKRAAQATPEPFRDILLSMARGDNLPEFLQ